MAAAIHAIKARRRGSTTRSSGARSGARRTCGEDLPDGGVADGYAEQPFRTPASRAHGAEAEEAGATSHAPGQVVGVGKVQPFDPGAPRPWSAYDDPYDESKRGPSGFWRYKEPLRIIYNDMRVQVFVAILIIANFVTSIVEKQLWPSEDPTVPGGRDYYRNFRVCEWFFNVTFTVELSANMYCHWYKEFWGSGWNVFDFITVAVSWLFELNLPLPGPLRLMRMVRALRVFRLFKRVKSLRKILESLARAVPGVMNAFLIMFIVMCIYAILAVDFFRDFGRDGEMEFEWCHTKIKGDRRHYPEFNVDTGLWETATLTGCPPYYTSRNEEFGHEYFGNFFKALYTMFQVLTGDSWSEAIGRPLIMNYGPIGTGKMVEEENDDDAEDSEDEEEKDREPERLTFQSIRKSLLANPVADAAAAAREKYRKTQEKIARLKSEGRDPAEADKPPPKPKPAAGKSSAGGRTARIPAVLQTEIYSLKTELVEIKATQRSILAALEELAGKHVAAPRCAPLVRVPGQFPQQP
ncbi:low voltage-gated calcium channel [Aureococcus anophagefferens]|nr:low voltage-gated calcium channel [Aureococcus anophagefferens]